MKSTRTYLCVIAALIALSFRSTGVAQVGTQQGIDSLSEEYQSLSRMYGTLNAGDTVYTPFFPTWSVQDRGLKLRIFSAFRNHNIQFSADDPVLVIATPDQQDIADVRIGAATFGKMASKIILSRELHQTILERKYEYKVEIPAGYTRE